ncbi:phage tail assembly protein [Limnohabitans sp.]|uniref:phage tail assembly protein n=1 Tax=Limnohabitans sp. TaxID=1907725 RepID=UPI00286F1137|nr:phage tail assembly protein [Limnohabitans sp.]
MKLTLKHPIVVSDKVTVTELMLREHTIANDYLAFDARGGVAQRIALIASIASTDEAMVKLMHGVDYRRAEAYVDRLLVEDEAQAADIADASESASIKK